MLPCPVCWIYDSLPHYRRDGHYKAPLLPRCSMLFGTNCYGRLRRRRFLRFESSWATLICLGKLEIHFLIACLSSLYTMCRSSLLCRVFALSDSRFFGYWKYTSFFKNPQARQARKGTLASNSKVIPRDRPLRRLSARIPSVI